MSVQLLRSAERFVSRVEGRTTRHLFSFGTHHDPARLGFAAMVAHNDETLPPGTGYPEHPHSEVEIVTWVLSGALRHTDSSGRTGVLLPGDVQRISAGTGIVHSEVTEPGVRTRFVQTWLRPDEAGRVPAYGVQRGHDTGLTQVVGSGGLEVGTAGARLLAGDVAGTTELPDAARLHLFVVGGRFRVGQDELGPGDSAFLTEQSRTALEVVEPGPVAVWAFGV